MTQATPLATTPVIDRTDQADGTTVVVVDFGPDLRAQFTAAPWVAAAVDLTDLCRLVSVNLATIVTNNRKTGGE